MIVALQRWRQGGLHVYLIVTAKMNDIDPQAWMADVLARLPDLPVSQLPELLPWHWKSATQMGRIAA